MLTQLCDIRSLYISAVCLHLWRRARSYFSSDFTLHQSPRSSEDGRGLWCFCLRPNNVLAAGRQTPTPLSAVINALNFQLYPIIGSPVNLPRFIRVLPRPQETNFSKAYFMGAQLNKKMPPQPLRYKVITEVHNGKECHKRNRLKPSDLPTDRSTY